MSTRSTIAIDNGNGTCTLVHCHCDGYPSHNGAVLLRYWGTEEKALELVAGGNLNSVRDDGSAEYRSSEGERSWEHNAPVTATIGRTPRYSYLWSNGRWMLDGLPLTAFDLIPRNREYDEHKLRAIAVIMAEHGGWPDKLDAISEVLASKTDEYEVTL